MDSQEDAVPRPRRQTRSRAVFALPKKKKTDVVFYTHFEEVLQKINPFGPYQIFCCIVILYASIEWTGNTTFMFMLGSLEPDWNCTMHDGTHVRVEAPAKDDKCDFLKSCASFKAIHDSVEFRSLVADFKLVCDDKDKVKWIEVIQAGGSLIGSVIGGHMGDHLGRKTMFFSGQLLIIITSIMSIAARNWIAFASIMAVNCFLYGIIEVTSLCLMMEYTSNKFRIIHTNAFQQPIAYMAIALIAYLTKDWQNFFVWLNMVACPLAIGFMPFLESPRWLIAKNKLDEACDVLNDIAHRRWNNTKAKFTTHDLSSIHTEPKQPLYNFFHLFSTGRLAKQSLMQWTSMFTYAMVSNTYQFTAQGMHDSVIMFTFLDGAFRLVAPPLIIFFDMKVTRFGRKLQFVGALLIEFALFGAVLALVCTGTDYQSKSVTILVIVATMINDCIFWINIVQITTQRYPTVVRCIAFGSLHSIKHIGSIVGFLVLRPLLTGRHSWIAFAIPEALILFCLVVGIFFQPETKGKAMLDQMVETNYGRFEKQLPQALMRLAAGHKVQQIMVREELKKEFVEAQHKKKRGEAVDSPFIYSGPETSSMSSVPVNEPRGQSNNGFESDSSESSESSDGSATASRSASYALNDDKTSHSTHM